MKTFTVFQELGGIPKMLHTQVCLDIKFPLIRRALSGTTRTEVQHA
jgi:hypothetical protein